MERYRKYDKGNRVSFLISKKRVKGRVTRIEGPFRRIVTDSNERIREHVRRLRPARDEALVLETRLDYGLKSQRHSGTFLREFLKAYDVEVLYEKVHSKKDLEGFLNHARKKNSNIRFIHYIGHGRMEKESFLCLTHENINLAKNLDLFSDLRGKVLIFSCCAIGGDSKLMRKIKRASSAAAIVCYRGDVTDSYTNLAEALIYHLLLRGSWKPDTIEASVGAVTNFLKVRPEGLGKHERADVKFF